MDGEDIKNEQEGHGKPLKYEEITRAVQGCAFEVIKARFASPSMLLYVSPV